MAELPLGSVDFTFSGLGERVAYVAKRSHHWYDPLYALFATATAYVRSRNDPQVETMASTDKLAKKWKQVGPSTVIAWAHYLLSERPEKRQFTMVENWIFPHASAALVNGRTAEEVRDAAIPVLKGEFERAPKGGLLFVPLIIGQGLIEVRHIVWVAADLQIKPIEYYDPKGIELETDEKGQVLANKDDKHRLVAGVMAALMFVSGYNEAVQNPVRHQYDINNCGVLGMGYLSRRRRTDKPFAKFVLGKEADLGEIRAWMAKEILENQPLVEESSSDDERKVEEFEM